MLPRRVKYLCSPSFRTLCWFCYCCNFWLFVPPIEFYTWSVLFVFVAVSFRFVGLLLLLPICFHWFCSLLLVLLLLPLEIAFHAPCSFCCCVSIWKKRDWGRPPKFPRRREWILPVRHGENDPRRSPWQDVWRGNLGGAPPIAFLLVRKSSPIFYETWLGASPPNSVRHGEMVDGEIWGGRPQSRFFLWNEGHHPFAAHILWPALFWWPVAVEGAHSPPPVAGWHSPTPLEVLFPLSPSSMLVLLWASLGSRGHNSPSPLCVAFWAWRWEGTLTLVGWGRDRKK